jgi:predicted nucleic acid-binding protein
MARLFLDSNVVIDGLVSAWTSSHMVLTLCAKQFQRVVLASYVIGEVEPALLQIAVKKSPLEAEHLINDYLKFVEISRPEIIALDDNDPEMHQARIIHHVHDIPVLAAAIKAKPDWLLTRNRHHFSDDIAMRTGLRIATPAEFLRQTLQAGSSN